MWYGMSCSSAASLYHCGEHGKAQQKVLCTLQDCSQGPLVCRKVFYLETVDCHLINMFLECLGSVQTSFVPGCCSLWFTPGFGRVVNGDSDAAPTGCVH